MAKKLQLRRGTTSQHSSFTGAVGEVTVDTDKKVVVVHDGSTAGGVPMVKAAGPTFTGTLTAADLDISGDVDVDGTLETDALTIGGVTLSETIADTVGAMVTSNTETGITVTYEDGDNTLDFAIGTLNQNTTGTAAIATAITVADESSDTTCFPTFVTAATGDLGAKSDSQLTYNSSTGALGATTFVGNVDAVDIDVDGTANLDAVDVDGDIDLAGDLTFSGAARDIKLLDNTAAALDITESTNSYIKFDTTNGDELITVSKATAGAIYDIGSSPGATITIDFANGNNQKVTLSANFTLANASNQVAGQSGTIFFIQPGGANYSISAIGNNWLWVGGTDGSLTATNGAIDRLDYIIQENGKIHAVISKGMAA